MLDAALGLLVLANVAIHVEQVEGIPSKAVGPLVTQVQKAIEEISGEAAAIDKKAGPCRDDEGCLGEVRARTGATEVVLLALASRNGVAVDAVRIGASGAKRESSVVLAGPPAKRTKMLRGMVDELMAPLGEAPAKAPEAPVAKAEPPPAAPPPAAPPPAAPPPAAPPPAAAVADHPPADDKPPKPIGVRVELAKGLPGKELTALAREVKTALEKETGRPAALDRKAGPCRQKDECVAELKTRVSAEDLIFISVTGSEQAVALELERVPPAGEKGKTVKTELTRNLDTWEAPIGKLVADLMAPEAPPAAPAPVIPFLTSPPAETPPPAPKPTQPPGASGELPVTSPTPLAATAAGPERPRSLLVPGIVLGGGALALAVGTAFGIMSSSARSEGESGSHLQTDVDRLESRARSTGLVANVLFATAGAALLTAAGIYVFD